MDMEFDKVKPLVGLVEFNMTAAREHVGEIERELFLVQEQVRCINTSLSYKYLHRMILIHLAYHATLWLNEWPATKGISATYLHRDFFLKDNLTSRMIVPRNSVPM